MNVPPLEEFILLHNNICAAFTDPKRMQIIYALSECAMNVTALSEMLDMPQPTVSRHLAALRQRGLVTVERNGTSAIYCVADARIRDVIDLQRQILKSVLEHQTAVIDTNPLSD